MTSSIPARIVIFGPESTGKTTLTRILAETFCEPWSAEYVRRFWDEHGGDIQADDLTAIARGQIAAEEAAVQEAQHMVFHDTDLLTCVLWNDLLFPGRCPDWVRQEANRRMKNVVHYLLCVTDIPFVSDPQRCFPEEEERCKMMQYWRSVLDSNRLPYTEVHGDRMQREKIAVQTVRQIMEE